ncbi:hypothetical protein [Bdellovibrio sp.]|uniref:hypothetical protein n=1 Tax=Bdellovibrio sp. TaxID=28201 RepID=UPI0032216190
MRKTMLIFTLLFSVHSYGLTEADCISMKPSTIAKQFITAIRLGAIGGFGNNACLEKAQSLDIQAVTETYEGSKQISLSGRDKVRIVNMVNDDGDKFTVIYEVIKDDKKIPGEFSFFKNNRFIDEDSVRTFKCAIIAEEPTVRFIDERCLD